MANRHLPSLRNANVVESLLFTTAATTVNLNKVSHCHVWLQNGPFQDHQTQTINGPFQGHHIVQKENYRYFPLFYSLILSFQYIVILNNQVLGVQKYSLDPAGLGCVTIETRRPSLNKNDWHADFVTFLIRVTDNNSLIGSTVSILAHVTVYNFLIGYLHKNCINLSDFSVNVIWISPGSPTVHSYVQTEKKTIPLSKICRAGIFRQSSEIF